MTTINTLSISGSSANAVTMSSKEIAELTGKAHKHVIRDIESMIAEIEKDGPSMDHKAKSKGYDIERDNRGYVKIIYLDRSHTYTLMTGYDARQRKKIIDRWMELEAQTAPTIKAPTNMVEALTLALEQQKAIAERDQEIAELIPQAKALTDLSGLEGEHNIRWSAAQCQMKEKLFIRELEEAGWVYRSQTTGRLTVYARARDAGYMTVKNVTIQHRSGEREGVGQPMLTQKGLAKIKTIIATKEAARVPFAKKPETEPA